MNTHTVTQILVLIKISMVILNDSMNDRNYSAKVHGDEAERGAQRAGREDPIASATAQLNKTKTPRTESNTSRKHASSQ